MGHRSIKIKTTLLMISMMLISCNKSVDSFSLLPDQNVFKQSGSSFAAKKIDILWVVDNSGSMATSQTNLASNFTSFITKFISQGSDFKMAVTTTDAYYSYYSNQTVYSRFHPGLGVYVMDKNTPNLQNVFINAITTGTAGSGDERAFSSFRKALENTDNTGFHRPDAFLAVIIVSDEDDFSHTDWTSGWGSYYFTEDYNYPGLHTISTYTNFLDTFTLSSLSSKNYSVNAITILDDACKTALNNTFTGRKIGTRYINLVNATNGTAASLCGNFSDSLNNISKNIIELASQFKLDREPVVSSIAIAVNGVNIPQDPVNGWTYDATTWTITFHGSSIPGEGATITINFDPVTVKL